MAPPRITPARNPGPLEQALVHHLHNIRAFQFIASAGSIVGAAQRLFKAPSAVTRQLQELERVVGQVLCERTPRGVLPNEQGERVLVRAARIAEELHKAAGELTRERSRTPSAPASALTDFLFNGRKLSLIVHIAEAGTISAAAERCGISQSGASMALSRLESTLRAPLFQRGKHGLLTTETAERFILRAQRALSELRHLSAELCNDGGVLRGSIVLGTSPLGRTQILPMAIASVLRSHPEIRVTMVESGFEQLRTSLRSGQIDAVVGVARNNVDSTDLTVEPLLVDRMAIVVRADHVWAGLPISPEHLQQARWILPWPHSPSRKLFDDGFRALRLEPPTASVESADLAAIRQLLISSDLLALVSARQMHFELQSGLIAELASPLPEMAREVGLIMRKNAMPSLAAETVLAAIKRQVRGEPRLG